MGKLETTNYIDREDIGSEVENSSLDSLLAKLFPKEVLDILSPMEYQDIFVPVRLSECS